MSFVCELCPRAFTQELYWKLHRESHVGDQISTVQCNHCDQQFLTRAKHDDHVYHKHLEFPSDVKTELSLECLYCSQQFESKLLLIIHKVDCVEKPPEQTKWPCQKCGKIFHAERFVTNHSIDCMGKEEKQNVEPVYKCDFEGCLNSYRDSLLFRNHLFSHSEYPFICQEEGCSDAFIMKINYLEHGLTAHGSFASLLSCLLCTQQFSTADQVEDHTHTAHDEEEIEEEDSKMEPLAKITTTEFSCKYKNCEKKLESLSDLSSHYLSHSGYNCVRCQTVLNSEQELSDHFSSTHNFQLNRYICPLCPSKEQNNNIGTEKLLLEHLVTCHPKPWSCLICQSPVYSLKEAQEHKVKHLTKYCDICGMTVRSTGNLISHIIKDHESEVFSCPVPGCSRVCGSRIGLENHLSTSHHQENWLPMYSCADCCKDRGPAYYYNLKQLEYHLESDHGQDCKPEQLAFETEVNCQFEGCPRQFLSINSLCQHQVAKHGDVLFKELPPSFYLHLGRSTTDYQLPISVNSKEDQVKLTSNSEVHAFIKSLHLKINLKPLKIKSLSESKDINVESIVRKRRKRKESNEESPDIKKNKTLPKENLQEGHKIISSSNNINTLPEEAIKHKFMSEIDKANVRIEPKTENIEMKESKEDHDLESVLDENSSISIQHVKAEVENMDPEYEKLEAANEEAHNHSTNNPQYENIVVFETLPYTDSAAVAISVHNVMNTIQSRETLNENNDLPNTDSLAAEAFEEAILNAAAYSNSLDSSTSIDFIATALSPIITSSEHETSNEVVDESELNISKQSSLEVTSLGTSENESTLKKQDSSGISVPKQVDLIDYILIVHRKDRSAPKEGDFVKYFEITPDNILNCVVPKQLQKDCPDISTGLAIDLQILCEDNKFSETTLSRYLYELLPPGYRPLDTENCLTEDKSKKIAHFLQNIKFRARKFRAKYNTLPKYLNKLLLEKYDPFNS